MARWRRLAPFQPGQQVGIGLFQQGFQHRAFCRREPVQLAGGKAFKPMFFFTSGAISAAVVGKLLDLSRGHAPLNPFATADAGPYSNVYLLLAGIAATAAVVFVRTFRGAKDESAISKSQMTNPK